MYENHCIAVILIDRSRTALQSAVLKFSKTTVFQMLIMILMLGTTRPKCPW